jgi:hypothetical protein
VKKLLALCVVGALAVTLTGCPGTPDKTGSTGGAPAKTDSKVPPPDTKPKVDTGKGEAGKPEKAEGTVVSATKDKVVIADKDKKEWTFAVTADTKVMRDGKASKAEDLKADDKATVTFTGKDKDAKATEIDAKPGTAAPPGDKPVDATVTADGDKITIKAGDKDYTLDAGTKITIDGKDAKPADVKKDMKGKATIKDGKVTEFAIAK